METVKVDPSRHVKTTIASTRLAMNSVCAAASEVSIGKADFGERPTRKR